MQFVSYCGVVTKINIKNPIIEVLFCSEVPQNIITVGVDIHIVNAKIKVKTCILLSFHCVMAFTFG